MASDLRPDPRAMTRAQIAQAAGVKEQAVSNWAHRYADFPSPVRADQQTGYPAADVAAWLDRRKIQKDDLRPEEEPGHTYGHRFRNATGLRAALARAERPNRKSTARLGADLWKLLEPDHKQSEDPGMYQELVMSLVCVQATNPAGWALVAKMHLADAYEVFRRVWRAQPTPLGVRSDLLKKIKDDGWWRGRLIRAAGALRQHVTPGADPQQADTAGRMMAVDAFDFLLDRFARARHRSNDEYLTPAELARLMARIAAPEPAERVHNPCCSSGEILLAQLAYQRESGAGPVTPGQVSGRALAERTWRLAVMNVAVHGGHIDLGDRPTGGLSVIDMGDGPYDVIVMNPPFRMSGWQLSSDRPSVVWPYGDPPAYNANFAWLQLAVMTLAPGGRAVVVMPNTTAYSQNSRDKQLRGAMVAQGAVRCVIELPGRLFRETSSPATLWILGRPDDRPRHDVLLIDGKEATEADGATHRVLTDIGGDTVLDVYQEWLTNTDQLPRRLNNVTATTVDLEQLERHGFDLRAAAYLRPFAPDATQRPTTTTPSELRTQLQRLHVLAADADRVLDQHLDRLYPWTH